MKLEFFRSILEKYSNNQFHKNPRSGRRVVACGRTDTQKDGRTDVQTDMTKLRSLFAILRTHLKLPYYMRNDDEI